MKLWNWHTFFKATKNTNTVWYKTQFIVDRHYFIVYIIVYYLPMDHPPVHCHSMIRPFFQRKKHGVQF